MAVEYSDIGKVIKAARDKQVPSWSRATLAIKAGLTPRQIERLETSEDPRTYVLFAACKALGLDMVEVVAASKGGQ